MDATQDRTAPGQIVILNGAPRSGKSSIARVIQDTFDGPWMNIGVDVAVRMTPERYRPGIGLRPGERGHRVARMVPVLYAALYESIAAHARLGLNVVVDVGHHESNNAGVLAACARRLQGLPVLFVGVRCSLDEVLRRRSEGGPYLTATPDEPLPAPVRLWQEEVHRPGMYDLEVDTTDARAEDCADLIRVRLRDGPPGTAFARLAGYAT